jgi:hypothetical protein
VLGEPTEIDELRQERERVMLADPATGLIPADFRKQELAFYNQVIAPNNKAIRGNTAPWASAGPWNVGGRTRAVAFDATNEKVMIAGAVSGGMWRSADGGASWVLTSDLGGYLGVTSISQDTRAGKQNIWYASTGEGSGNSASGGGSYYFGDGIFKSVDSGKSWALLPSTSSGLPNGFSNALQISWRIATHPSTDSNYLFVATYGGVYRSTNGGTTWALSLGGFGGNDAYYTDISITTTGVIYATVSSDGNGKGFWRSADKGLSWTSITPSNFNSYDRTVMGINPNNENEVYFFTYMPDSTNVYSTKTSNYKGDPEWISLLKYTYISGNGDSTGSTWTNLSPNLPNNANVSTGPFDHLNCQGGYDMLVRVQPQTGYVYIGGTNIFVSRDAFTSPNRFTQIGGYKKGTTLPFFKIWDNHHPDNHDILFYPSDPLKVLSASDGGVRMTMDGNDSINDVVWITLNNGYLSSQIYTVTLDPTLGSNWMLAGFQDNGNFVTTNFSNPQQIWKLPFNGDGAYNYIAPNRAFYVMSIQEGKVAKFTLDNTGAPTAFGRIDPIGPTKDDYTFINPLVVDPNDNNIMYLPAGKRLWRQNQLSTLPMTGTWDSIATGWFKLSDTITASNTGNNLQFPAQITAIAVSKSPANTVYIGTSNRDVYRVSNANTGNPSFVKINKGFMAGFVSGIAIDPEDDKKVMVCYSNYNTNSIFYSSNGGDSFKHVMGNLRKTTSNYSGVQPSVRCVAILKTTEGKRKYYVGTSVGLYSADSLKPHLTASKDSTNWVQESPNLIGTNIVVSIDARPADGMVAIGTHGGGAFYSKQFYSLSIQNNIRNLLTVFNLAPNPTSNVCNVSIELASATALKMYVCSLQGAKMLTIKNEFVTAGKHTFSCSTQSLANGNYIMVAEDANGQRQTSQFSVQH